MAEFLLALVFVGIIVLAEECHLRRRTTHQHNAD